MSECRFLDTNYFFKSALPTTASSTDPSFPLSNLLNYFRSKPWRSLGNYVIGSTNNKLDFKDSGGGSVLTATIPSATYTPQTLAAAIAAAMLAVGGFTYTITFAAGTGKFTIVTSGTFLSLLWNSGSHTANSIGPTIGFPVSADSTAATTYTSTNIALHTEEWVVIDLGSAQNVDSFAVVFDPTDGVKLSGSAAIHIQANASNSWASPSVDVTLAVDANYNVITYFWASVQNFRYWRVWISDPQNTNLYVELPKVILCQATQLSQMPSLPFDPKVTDLTVAQKTAYGHLYGDIYPRMRTFALNYNSLSDTDMQTMELMFERMGKFTPLAVALDDTATLFDKDRFFLYCHFLDQDFSYSNSFYSYFDTQIMFEEAF